MKFTPELRREYEDLFSSCIVHPNRVALADQKVAAIVKNKPIYQTIADKTNELMPWWVVGVIHLMECGLSFQKHLHNGDPLTARTKRVPANRPLKGEPPFTFSESALDALKLKGFDKEKDFTTAHILFLLEGFNGYGYRLYHPEVKSPYLWSFTNHYTEGKYVADGKYSATAVSQQLGIAAVIKLGLVTGSFL